MTPEEAREVVSRPGKFEGEQAYVPYYWDIALEGFADREDDGVSEFDVTPEDRKQFPELGDKQVVRLRERDDGFVIEV